MLNIELATAHASGDCKVDCTHPDHLWDTTLPDLEWLMFGAVHERRDVVELAGFVAL